MKMRYVARLGGHFAPAVREYPANETTRPRVVPEVAGQGTEKQPDVLIKRVELILQRLARAEQVAGDLAVHLQEKTGFRFVIGVIGGEKIGEQFSILIHGIDRLAEESRITAEFSYRLAI